MNSCWSLKTLFVASVGILLLTVALGGCFGGSEKATVGGIIKGHVTEINLTGLTDEIEPSVSGHGVPRASVSLIGTDKVSTTNNRGEFTFSNVASGTYDILAKKNGWASAMAYEVVAEVNKATEVILYMTKPEDASEIKESIPPTVFLSCSRSIIHNPGHWAL
ncbi:MAG: carboxypeptidase-like regulatory domain-containing protein [Bacillota bacterium]